MPGKATKPLKRKAKQERARATVNVILDAAAQILVGEGYARATTNRIAERAGVSVGSVYQYFGNKDHVFARLIDREVQAVTALFVADQCDSDDTLMKSLRRIVTVAVEAWSYGPLLYRQLEQVPGAALRDRVAEAKKLLAEFIRSLLEQHRGELRVRDLDVATFIIINASIGLSTNSTPEIYGDGLVEMTIEVLERYLIADS